MGLTGNGMVLQGAIEGGGVVDKGGRELAMRLVVRWVFRFLYNIILVMMMIIMMVERED